MPLPILQASPTDAQAPRGGFGVFVSYSRDAGQLAGSNGIGRLVALDQRSSVISLPLLAKTADGRALDYGVLAGQLETLRTKYQGQGVDIHTTGFAMVVGDLIDGIQHMLLFIAAAVAIATATLYGTTRCIRSALLVVACSLVAVLWQLGLLPLLGYQLDPYSVLVPSA